MSMNELNDELDVIAETKSQLKTAIISKGQNIQNDDQFRTYVDKVNNIVTLQDGTADANAVANNIEINKTAYVNGEKITGTLPNMSQVNYISGISVEEKDNYLDVNVINNIKQIIDNNSTISIRPNKNSVTTAIGLTPEKLLEGNTVLGINGTSQGVSETITSVKALPHIYLADGELYYDEIVYFPADITIGGQSGYLIIKQNGEYRVFISPTTNIQITQIEGNTFNVTGSDTVELHFAKNGVEDNTFVPKLDFSSATIAYITQYSYVEEAYYPNTVDFPEFTFTLDENVEVYTNVGIKGLTLDIPEEVSNAALYIPKDKYIIAGNIGNAILNDGTANLYTSSNHAKITLEKQLNVGETITNIRINSSDLRGFYDRGTAIEVPNTLLATVIGLTPDKIVKGNTILGVVGTAEAGGLSVDETQQAEQLTNDILGI